MALGYLGSNVGGSAGIELKGQEYFQNLAMRSLFQDFERSSFDGKITSCKMHDIVHDFAQSLRKDRSSGRLEAAVKNTICQSCSPLSVAYVKEYRSLFLEHEYPVHICDCRKSLRALGIPSYSGIIPRGMEYLIHLKWLDLSGNYWTRAELKTIFRLYNLQTLCLRSCHLQEIPGKIGNLIHLLHLNLSENANLKLPERICDLHELQTLDVTSCKYLDGLPQGIHNLVSLKHLHFKDISLVQFPKGLAQLSGLRTLSEFCGGSGWSKLGWLKNLNHLSECLQLWIYLTDDLKEVVEDAREAELRNKIHIQTLAIMFRDELNEKQESSVRFDVLDALEAHRNLPNLKISGYKDSKFPSWIMSPLNHLRKVGLFRFIHLSSLPSFAELPCLEEIFMSNMYALEFQGQEFLGVRKTKAATRGTDIRSSSSGVAGANTIGFRKLKKLTVEGSNSWMEWEGITVEEEESSAMSLMPCLATLAIHHCIELTSHPHRLLHKASSLDISGSTKLEKTLQGQGWFRLEIHIP
ncbi:hypothetical protein ACS0TY_035261 [Phlomoides rotata]